jgi:lysophospholipase L1-like esterase
VDNSQYGKRFSLTFNQRFRTLPLNGAGAKNWIHCWLGTNDLFYAKDAGVLLSAETIFQREAEQITRIRNEFPNAYLTTATSIARETTLSPNYRQIIRDKNNLQKDNYVSLGINKLIDVELEAHPDFNALTGNSTASSQCYTGANGDGTPDNTHPNDFGYLQIANLMKIKALEIKAEMNW